MVTKDCPDKVGWKGRLVPKLIIKAKGRVLPDVRNSAGGIRGWRMMATDHGPAMSDIL